LVDNKSNSDAVVNLLNMYTYYIDKNAKLTASHIQTINSIADTQSGRSRYIALNFIDEFKL